MFLQESSSGDLLRIQDVEQLMDPFEKTVNGCMQAGEEEQEPRDFNKSELSFPSGESLPKCWRDPEWKSRVKGAS
jgi:hypothetical protein